MYEQEEQKRINDERMAYYRRVYRKSRKWDGKEKIKGKRICIYGEQGFGDIIQFARYFSMLKRHGCYLILHCPKELHRLLHRGKVDEVLDKDNENLPPHDFHVLSMSLPFLLERTETKFLARPYIQIHEKEDLSQFGDSYKIGIMWEGSPTHSNNSERSCPLKFFRPLTEKGKLFMLTNQVFSPDLIDDEIELYSAEIADFYDVAKLINSVDIVISVDTAALHLAGAMNKDAIGLLSYRYDPRWDVANWYPSVRLIRQKEPGNWQSVLDQLKVLL